MSATVVCGSCNRSWDAGTSDSVYLELELLSRPCPYCEAYTLGYRAVVAARLASPFPRRRRPPSSAAGRGGARLPHGR